MAAIIILMGRGYMGIGIKEYHGKFSFATEHHLPLSIKDYSPILMKVSLRHTERGKNSSVGVGQTGEGEDMAIRLYPKPCLQAGWP